MFKQEEYCLQQKKKKNIFLSSGKYITSKKKRWAHAQKK